MRLKECLDCGRWELHSAMFAGSCRACQPDDEEETDDAETKRRRRNYVSPDRTEQNREQLTHREMAIRHRTINNMRRLDR